jgi:hypothetical protein
VTLVEEVEREVALAAEMLRRGRVLEGSVPVRRAWDATARALASGAPAEEVTRARLLVISYGLGPWVRQASDHALALRDDSERAEWLSGLRRLILKGLDWIEDAIARDAIAVWRDGEVGGERITIERMRADWAPFLEGLALAERAPLA